MIAIVELADGVRVTTNIVGDDPSSLRIGQRVIAVFDRSASGEVLLRFRPDPSIAS